MKASPNPESGPDPDPDFESLLRQRASRLAKPDPAWRAVILESAQNEPGISALRARCSLWQTRWFPATLAACWLVIPALNWSARQETKRFSQYANAGAASMLTGGWDRTVVLAAASRR